MSRLLTIAAVLICLSLIPATLRPQEKEKPDGEPKLAAPVSESMAILKTLDQTISTRGLEEEVTLRIALEYLTEMSKVQFIVEKEGFAAILGADAPDPFSEKISLRSFPQKVPMHMALRQILSQVCKGRATYVVRNGFVIILPVEHTLTANALGLPVQGVYDKKPLQEVLNDLADQTGLTINADPRLKEKAKTPISLTLRNATLEDALIAVTEQAELKFAVLQTSVIVASPDNAYSITQEEKRRNDAPQRPSPGGGARRLEPAAE